MGLIQHDPDSKTIDPQFLYQRSSENETIIALAGNPNVGKSTIFNTLTKMHQHTGNWPGKTVTTAFGTCNYKDDTYVFVDLPGTYSLLPHSTEEEIARDYICFSDADVIVVVCDAVCLERNLNLVYQTIEITPNTIVCVNLMDEAKKKNISIDLTLLSQMLGVPVVGTSAVDKKSLSKLMDSISQMVDSNKSHTSTLTATDYSSIALTTNLEPLILYPPAIEEAISSLCDYLEHVVSSSANLRWISLKLLDEDTKFNGLLSQSICYDLTEDHSLQTLIESEKKNLVLASIKEPILKDCIVASILSKASLTAKAVVSAPNRTFDATDRKIDKLLTSKRTGFPIMILLLLIVLWLTIFGANYPSSLLFDGFHFIETRLLIFAEYIHMPTWLSGVLFLGIYRVLTWVISVMLPPMAIFFPLFTLLEDLGYLPRVAFNLDHQFHRACACGKQALTMCMGFGCNAAGIVGCRIIDSPRERLIAIITNNFVPCNGRFPTLIAIITMFFVRGFTGVGRSFLSAMFLTGVILLGIFMTFITSRILSKTILKGVASSFTLELPPYRKPQIGKIIVRSIFDRTLFVLGRAIAVAAPAGLIIWFLANVTINDASLLSYCTNQLDPLGRLIGLDGVILMAFILGFPANEIVIPIIIMSYLCTGSLLELSTLAELKSLLVQNGWTWLTAVCLILFSLMHWPCSTTCLTIKKETQSFRWTVISFLVPTITGFVICFLVATVCRLLFF